MSLTELFPKILLALVTTIFDDVYKHISRRLTNKDLKIKKEHDQYIGRNDFNKKLTYVLDQSNNSKQIKIIFVDYSLNRRDSIPSFETLSLSQAEIECLQPKWQDLHENFFGIIQ